MGWYRSRKRTLDTSEHEKDVDSEAPARRRPSLRQAFWSLPFGANSLFGWLLVGTFWMPFTVGCDKKSVLVPADILLSEPPYEMGEWMLYGLCDWPYLLALVICVALIVIAIVRPARLEFWLIPIPLYFLSQLIVLGWIWLIAAVVVEGEGDAGFFVFIGLAVGLPTAVLIWMWRARRKQQLLLAATRGLCGLALLIPFALYLKAVATLASRFLYGFYLGVFASVGLTITAWFLYSRGERSFSDTRLPKRVVQFRIRTIMVWTAIIAAFAALIQKMNA